MLLHFANLRQTKQHLSFYGKKNYTTTPNRIHKKYFTRLLPKSKQLSMNTTTACTKCGCSVAIDVHLCIMACTNCGFSTKIVIDKHMSNELKPIANKVSTQLYIFCSQFLPNRIHIPHCLLNHMYMSYRTVHFPYKTKVYSSRTQNFLKTYKRENYIYRRACERISMLLRNDYIPTLYKEDIMLLYRQRRLMELLIDNEDIQISVNYTAYIRQLGQANGIIQTRVFHNAKTQKIHMKQCTLISKQLYQTQAKLKLNHRAKYKWELSPFC